MTTGFDIAVGASNIASLFFQFTVGLSHLLKNKDPASVADIREKSRNELCAAFDILDAFHTDVGDDSLSPLVERYNK